MPFPSDLITPAVDRYRTEMNSIRIMFSLACAIPAFIGDANAQDWNIPLGGEAGAVLDARTIQNIYPAGHSGWVKYNQPTDEGMLTVEMQLFAICSANVVSTMRMVALSTWSDRVMEYPIPEHLSRNEIPSENEVINNFFFALCD